MGSFGTIKQYRSLWLVVFRIRGNSTGSDTSQKQRCIRKVWNWGFNTTCVRINGIFVIIGSTVTGTQSFFLLVSRNGRVNVRRGMAVLINVTKITAEN